MSKFFGFSSFYSGNFGFLFVCLCFWVIGFGVELVVLTESEVFFFHWLVEGETKGIWNFGFLFFCVGVLVLVTNFYEFLVYLCWGWISWIWGWGRNVKFGVFLYFFYWVWIGYFFKKVIFLGGLIGFGLFLFIFIWLMRKWRRAERVKFGVLQLKGLWMFDFMANWVWGFFELRDNLSLVELHWFCKRMWLLVGFDWNECSFSSRGRIEKKRELLKLLSFGPGWVANVWFGGELGLRLYEF